MLRSTSGSSIDKFELMEHPSAKYDAEGQGGIINIKTKRNALSGLNGEIGTDDGGMYFGETGRFLMRENVNGSLSYRTAKTNTFVSAYQGIYDMDIDMNIDNKLTQDGGSVPDSCPVPPEGQVPQLAGAFRQRLVHRQEKHLGIHREYAELPQHNEVRQRPQCHHADAW